MVATSLGRIVRFMYVFILDLLLHSSPEQLINIMLIMGLLSIGSILIETISTNLILKR